MLLLGLLLFISLTFGKEICLDLRDRGEDPYVAERLYYHLRNLFLEAGLTLSCSDKSQKMYAEVSYSETPISISPKQRVSNYIFYLKVRLNDREFISSAPYSVNSSYGEIPRRKAVDEAFGRMKLSVLEYALELKKHAGAGGN